MLEILRGMKLKVFHFRIFSSSSPLSERFLSDSLAQMNKRKHQANKENFICVYPLHRKD